MWKYVIMTLNADPTKQLNDAGAEGWELVSIYPIVHGQGGSMVGAGIKTDLQAVFKKKKD